MKRIKNLKEFEKMKRKCMAPLVLIAVMMLSLVGCSSGTEEQAAPPAGEEQTEGAETQGEASSEQSTVTGTIDTIKDFKFEITDSEGRAYAFFFEEEKPSGLETVKEGDTVAVTYTGELSETDVFDGEIISVEKAE